MLSRHLHILAEFLVFRPRRTAALLSTYRNTVAPYIKQLSRTTLMHTNEVPSIK